MSSTVYARFYGNSILYMMSKKKPYYRKFEVILLKHPDSNGGDDQLASEFPGTTIPTRLDKLKTTQ